MYTQCLPSKSQSQIYEWARKQSLLDPSNIFFTLDVEIERSVIKFYVKRMHIAYVQIAYKYKIHMHILTSSACFENTWFSGIAYHYVPESSDVKGKCKEIVDKSVILVNRLCQGYLFQFNQYVPILCTAFNNMRTLAPSLKRKIFKEDMENIPCNLKPL